MSPTSSNADEPLTFQVIGQHSRVPQNARFQAFLNRDRWDDWGKFCTQFYLTIVDSDGVAHDVGQVKIGQFDLQPHSSVECPTGHRSPDLSSEFDQLDETFFSLGQNDSYYERLNGLGDAIRESVLIGLRDMAFDDALWLKAKDEYVTKESLCRSITNTTVEGQFRRMAHGGARLTRYRFSYVEPKRGRGGRPPMQLDFNVRPKSRPPTNVHVLIGRNGVGKTRLLTFMTKALIGSSSSSRQYGSFIWDESTNDANKFSNLVTISFSAFDDSEIVAPVPESAENLKYSYIGLRRNTGTDKSFGKPKSPNMLASEFVKSLEACRSRTLQRRWRTALTALESDPVFRSAALTELIDKDLADEEQRAFILKTFGMLSSGHKIVSLTLTRLIETVEEKTLVLIDEPEAHLHPPLLSAFVRALSNLLVDRNGVAVIATHSPVVLQEVPKSCVWILSRSLSEAKAERPTIETFGENVGILAREAFQLELSQAGFHEILAEAVNTSDDYIEAIEAFDGQLGAEARAVLRAMFLEKGANPE